MTGARWPKLIFFFAGLIGLVWLSPARAEKIDDLSVIARFSVDGSLNVIETVGYNFENAKLTTVTFAIPIKYQYQGNGYNLAIDNLAVTDSASAPFDFQAKPDGDNLLITVNNDVHFFPDTQTFRLSYRLSRIMRYRAGDDLFYWLVTGNGRPIKVGQSRINITLPKKVAVDLSQAKCFYGPTGKELTCQTKVDEDRVGQIYFDFNNSFETFAGENNSVTFVLPKGVIYEPSWLEILKRVAYQNWLIGLPILILLIFAVVWRRRKRTVHRGGQAEILITAPDKLTPAEIGVLIDERVGSQDLIGELIYLAQSGYFKIARLDNDFLLTDLNKGSVSQSYQQAILSVIFAGGRQVKLSELGKIFVEHKQTINRQIYQSIVDKGYFTKNPARVRIVYAVIGAALAVSGVWLAVTGFGNSLPGIIGSLLSGVIIVIFGLKMPRRTRLGVETGGKISGFKYYLLGGHNLFTQTNPKTQEQFETYLPFAVVLGVDKDWSYQFNDLRLTPPLWFDDPAFAGHYSAMALVDSLIAFQQACYESLF